MHIQQPFCMLAMPSLQLNIAACNMHAQLFVTTCPPIMNRCMLIALACK